MENMFKQKIVNLEKSISACFIKKKIFKSTFQNFYGKRSRYYKHFE